MEHIGSLRHALKRANDELITELKRDHPNPGKVQRLEAEKRKLDRRIAKMEKESAERMEKNRRKALQRKNDPERNAERLLRKAKRLADKAVTLKRGTPVKKVNKVRAAKAHEERFSPSDGYHAYIKSQPCLRCGRFDPNVRSDFAHMKGVDLGGKAEHGIPLCRLCHSWQEVNKLRFNKDFELVHGIPPLEMARAMREAYLLRKEG